MVIAHAGTEHIAVVDKIVLGVGDSKGLAMGDTRFELVTSTV